MVDTTNLEIVTPSKVLVSEPVEMVVLPGSDGNIGALPRHSKVMSSLDRGVVDILMKTKLLLEL
jgi:F-type H+-transporting ATPase subunit epsilon